MEVRHYPAGTTPRKRKLSPDAELEINLAMREAVRPLRDTPDAYQMRSYGVYAIRGAIKYRKPKRVRANSGYYRPGRTLGPRYTTREADYFEFTKDVERKRSEAAPKQPKQDSMVIVEHKSDIDLMARMGTIHDANEL